jgi:hypothetical protein
VVFSGICDVKNSNVAFLWDESFLWGLMAYKALKKINLPFDLVRSADINNGALDHYKMLFVPGGWASNKSRMLDDSGIMAIRRFVESGGSYLGFCGGAGLATQAKSGIELLDVQRKSTRERVPSFSGRIHLNVNDHQIWEGLMQGSGGRGQGAGKKTCGPDSSLLTLNSKLIFHAWWPSQFVINENTVKSLASFGNALPDAFSSDVNIGDVAESGNWDELEEVYQINLDPRRLYGEPAVIEGCYGKGRVVLSLVHFDTPEDINGQKVLIQLWEYLSGETEGAMDQRSGGKNNSTDSVSARCNLTLHNVCSELISLGERNFLWFWRNSMLLQWRRGVRGLEYNTLYIMMKEISEIMDNKNDRDMLQYAPALESMKDRLHDLVERAKKLLILERHALLKGPITYIKCDDPEIQRLRKDLFGDAKSHGGMFKGVLDEVDGLLYELLTN